MKRRSKPGLREYCGADNIPRALNGLGIVILSTSRGVMTDKEARKVKVGGEVLCTVY
jgi:small subunit ribosomal protein S8